MIDTDLKLRNMVERFRDPEIYCEKCDHTGRFFSFDAQGNVKYTYCDCYERKISKDKYPTLLARSRIPAATLDFDMSQYVNGGTTDSQRSINVQNVAKVNEIVADIRGYIKGGKNLYVQGHTGTGKTYIAAYIARQALMNGFSAAYVAFNRAIDAMMNSDDYRWVEYMRYADCLVVDNIDNMTMKNDLHHVMFDRLVRQRVQARRSNIYISKTPFKMIYEKLGFENQSLMNERCTRLSFVGEDHRYIDANS